MPYSMYRALIVDDVPDTQQLLKLLLETTGLQVDTADDGELAVSRVLLSMHDPRPYDLVFMDCNMPRMDGYTATRAIRAQGFAGPIVMLSANLRSVEADRAKEAGCNEFLGKPVDFDRLLALVGKYLAPKDDNAAIYSTRVDEQQIAELLEGFLRDLRVQSQELSVSIDGANVNETIGVAHRIRGGAAMYGYPGISELAGEIEMSLRDGGSLASIDSTRQSLQRQIERTTVGRE